MIDAFCSDASAQKEITSQTDYYILSTLVISKSKGPAETLRVSVLRHIKCAELRKIPNEQPNFTDEHVTLRLYVDV